MQTVRLARPCCCYHVCKWLLDGLRHGIQEGNSQALSSNKQTGRSSACGISWWPCLNVRGKWERIGLTYEQQCWKWCLLCCGVLWWLWLGLQQRERNGLCGRSLSKCSLTTNLVWQSTRNTGSIKSWEWKTVTKYQSKDFLHPPNTHPRSKACLFCESSLLWQLNSGSKPSTFIHFPNALRSEQCACLTVCSYKRIWPFFVENWHVPQFSPFQMHTLSQNREDVHLEQHPARPDSAKRSVRLQVRVSIDLALVSGGCERKFIMSNEDGKLQNETALQNSWIQKKSSKKKKWLQYQDGIMKTNTECTALFKMIGLRKWYIKAQNIIKLKCLVWHRQENLGVVSNSNLGENSVDQKVFSSLTICMNTYFKSYWMIAGNPKIRDNTEITVNSPFIK